MSLIGETARQTNESVHSYIALLDHILEDGRIDEAEGELLVEWGRHSGLSGADVERIHREYIGRLAKAAVERGTLSHSLRKEFESLAKLLGVKQSYLNQILKKSDSVETAGRDHEPESCPPTAKDFRGRTVCFTGQSQCSIEGEEISRETAEELAGERGLFVADSVTRGLHILVVADPCTMSGKAKKARQYGTRIIHEPLFWQALGIKID
jgi:DNA polymerase III subunit epsilon